MTKVPTDSNTEDRFESFLGLLWAVCTRPGLYTVGGSPLEIWAFAHGAETGYFGDLDKSEQPFAAFATWLGSRFSIEPSVTWQVTLQDNPDLFSSMSKDDIWALLVSYFRQVHGIEHRPVQLLPCGYSHAANRRPKTR